MLGKYSLGVMQGRLLPKYKGRYQAYPKGYWQHEFDVAADLGLELIEFILDYEDAEENPLLSADGVDEVLRVMARTGVAVKSICADYFMEAPLHVPDESQAEKSQAIMRSLLANAGLLGVRDVVVPCVDQSSIADAVASERFVQRMLPIVEDAEGVGVNLSLETDLAPAEFSALLAKFDAECVTVNYDIGNSAALGYDPEEEFSAYGSKISDIHIKDRILGGGPVELGAGAADFEKVFRLVRQVAFDGPMIMQAYRDDEGVMVFKRQQQWLLEKFASLLSN